MRFCDACGRPQIIQAVRPRERLLHIALPKFHITRPQWSATEFRSDILCGLGLFVATVLMIYPFFSGNFTRNWGSIESAYISDSVFIANSFPNVGWFPYWYGGLSFRLSYPPLFIYLVAFVHGVSGLSVGQSYRIVSGIAYCTAPVALYLLARVISKSRVAGFFAGLTYSFVPTFLPSIGHSHVEILTMFGEGPHLLGLTLALLTILQLFRCAKRPTSSGYLITAVLFASVALTNSIALYALAFLTLVFVATEVIYRNNRALIVLLFSGLVAYGLAASTYDLEFISTNYRNAAESAQGAQYSLLLLPLLIVTILILRRYLSRRLSQHVASKPFFFASLWVLLLGGIIIGRYWFKLPEFAPQPVRYVPEFDLGLSLLIGLLLMRLANKISVSGMGQHGTRTVMLKSIEFGLVLVVLLVSAALHLPLSISATQPSTSLANVAEYQIPRWLVAHVRDESVFASGTVAFWLNVFSNIRQMRGGSDQGATNTWWAHVEYQMVTGSDPQLSVLWAQAWNVKYIVVTFPNASTPYHDYKYPEKFKNVLPIRYYVVGHGVFEVPLPRPALVEDISAQGATSLKPIADVLDTRGISAYVNLTQRQSNPPGTQVTYTIVNPDLVQVSVSGASTDTAILLKMTYDPGWHAELNGRSIRVSRIGPDFMITYPQTEGDYQLTFRFESSQTTGWYLTITTIAVLAVGYVFLGFRRMRQHTTHMVPHSAERSPPATREDQADQP